MISGFKDRHPFNSRSVHQRRWSELCAPIDSLIAALAGRLLSSERDAPTQTFNCKTRPKRLTRSRARRIG